MWKKGFPQKAVLNGGMSAYRRKHVIKAKDGTDKNVIVSDMPFFIRKIHWME